MTTADVLALLWRRWYVVLLGLLVTVFAVQDVRQIEPVYWSQAEVTLVGPRDPDGPNELTGTTKSLIAMAGLVVADVEGEDAPPAVSDRVDLPGLGIRDGWEVRLPNAGGQWEPDFNRPVVDAQVVASSPQEAAARLTALVARVRATLESRQADDGIPSHSRIRTSVSLDDVRVVGLSGSTTRASAMVLLLGLAASVGLAMAVDAAHRRWRQWRRRQAGVGSQPDGRAGVIPHVPAPHVATA
jgi:hypothetical protein